MSVFDALQNSTISVRRSDGTVHQNIRAVVTPRKITFDHQGVLLESGDLIHREMSNGGQEIYEVIDPCFHEQFHTIPAYYQAVVKKLGIPEARSKIDAMTINVTGPNSRVNLNSIDHSTNTVSYEVSEQINALEDAIKQLKLANDEHKDAMEVLASVRSQFENGKPNRTVLKALFSALPAAANVSSIASLILTMIP